MQLELKALQQEVGITFVYVTHDQEEALTMSDVIVVMRDGRIQQLGGPAELYERPVNRFVADFIGVSNPIPGRVTAFESATRRATDRDRPRAHARGTGDRHRRRPRQRATSSRSRSDPSGSRSSRRRAATAEAVDRLDGRPGPHQPGNLSGRPDGVPIDTDLAGELIVRRQNVAGTSGGAGLGPGDPVIVRWHEDANLVLVG